MSTYRWFTDSGHGWLRVPIEDVRTAGVINRMRPIPNCDGR